MAASLKPSMTRSRTLARNAGSAASRSTMSSQAPARALGSRGGTITPTSPRIRVASPTSVETQGTPQAMASAKTLGKPSPWLEVKVARSKPL